MKFEGYRKGKLESTTASSKPDNDKSGNCFTYKWWPGDRAGKQMSKDATLLIDFWHPTSNQ